MKLEHLKSMLFQKNKKGNYREIHIIPKIPKEKWESGGTRKSSNTVVSRCTRCNVPVAVTRGVSVVAATCWLCTERQRLARLSVG